jgi:8-oxo-dGTP diphosphatase
MRGDGDAWIHCVAGHRHWGRHGAAGLFLTDGSRAVLQHRAPWTHEGDTWGLPGGARDTGETPVQAAFREAHEEADLDSALIEPIAMSIADHVGWSYMTVLARPRAELLPHAANAESVEIRWCDFTEIDALPLHPGFAASWPVLRQPVPRLVIVVPDDLLTLSTCLQDVGLPTDALPDGLVETPLDVLVPRITSDAGEVVASDVVLRVDVDVSVQWLRNLATGLATPETR